MSYSLRRIDRPRGLLALALLLAAGCASAPERATPAAASGSASPAVSAIAERLVAEARVRAELSGLRVGLLELRESERLGAARPASAPAPSRALAAAIAAELGAALARRVHLVDTALEPVDDVDAEALAAEFGATHALVGTFVRRPEDVLVSVRLVELDTRLVLATARGGVPLDELVLATPAERGPAVAANGGGAGSGNAPDGDVGGAVALNGGGQGSGNAPNGGGAGPGNARAADSSLSLPDAPARVPRRQEIADAGTRPSASRVTTRSLAAAPDGVEPTAEPPTSSEPLAAVAGSTPSAGADPGAAPPAEPDDAPLVEPPTPEELAEAARLPPVEGPASLRLKARRGDHPHDE